jgi:hypothetical protein
VSWRSRCVLTKYVTLVFLDPGYQRLADILSWEIFPGTLSFSGFCRICYRLRAALLCWISLSFTKCIGLQGHLQVCRIFYFHMLKGFCFAAFWVHCLSLHVSAYMAIFMRVGYFIFICLKDSASLLFFCLFWRGHTLHVFHLCFVPVLFSFVIFVVSLRVCLLTISLSLFADRICDPRVSTPWISTARRYSELRHISWYPKFLLWNSKQGTSGSFHILWYSLFAYRL